MELLHLSSSTGSTLSNTGITCLLQIFSLSPSLMEVGRRQHQTPKPKAWKGFVKNHVPKNGTERVQRWLFSLSTFLVCFVAFYILTMNPNCSQGT